MAGRGATSGTEMRGVRRLIVLGSTGSIGTQALEVVRHLNGLHRAGVSPVRFEVVGLAAGRNAGLLAEQASEFGVRECALAEGGGVEGVRCRVGPGAAEALVREVESDVVLASIVGVAGLPATLAAVELGRDVALANKETLVAAGALVVPAARRSGARLLPVDSEHSAAWQCLAGLPGCADWPPMIAPVCVQRLVLTASGGPFRTWTSARAYDATPEQALAHPTWSMGAKVTIDSATLVNKGLEVVEAHWLFGLGADRIGVLIHPGSIVHAIAELADGSAIAQLGAPDMRVPIQHALCAPLRLPGCGRSLDLDSLRTFEFETPCEERFPAIGLARRVVEVGGTAGAVFNAANEAAVDAFLRTRLIPFGRIVEIVREAMEAIAPRTVRTLADVMEADGEARAFVASLVGELAGRSVG